MLELTLNNDADNLNYTDKRKIYKKSRYMWLKLFMCEHDKWDENQITKSAGKMAEIYYRNIFGKEINS